MRVPIYFSGSIPLQDIADALHQAGIHIRIEAGHRFVAERVPRFLTEKANVVPLEKRRKA